MEELEQEDEEEFFESLDGILSSSDEEPDRIEPRCFDPWLSEPGPVEDRRRRLLLQLGLSADRSLARRSPDEDAQFPPAGRQSASSQDADSDDDRRCTIRDLDNGKEFVVGGGVPGDVREVGTGRRLTAEEFDARVGGSPIVRELMRRAGAEEGAGGDDDRGFARREGSRVGWFRGLRSVVAAAGGRRDRRRSGDEKDTEGSSEKGGRRSSSATDDSQDSSPQVARSGAGRERERVRVRQYGKSWRELSGLYLSQEIRGHGGAIWTVKLSLDGRFLASAGEDCVVHVWQVLEEERKVDLAAGGAGEESFSGKQEFGGRKVREGGSLKVPEQVFGLSERPVCSFVGHLDDVLDLSWSRSQVV